MTDENVRRVKDQLSEARASERPQDEPESIADALAVQTDQTGWIRVGTSWVDATRVVAVERDAMRPDGSGAKVVIEIGDTEAVYIDVSATVDDLMERIVYATTADDEEEDDDK